MSGSCATAAIPIEQLAKNSTFLETSYLLIYGELPTADELLRSPRGSPGTPCCTRTSSGSSTASPVTPTRCRCSRRRSRRCRPSTRTRLDPFKDDQVELSSIRLLAKMPTIAAYAYKKSIGQPLLYPDNSRGSGGELPPDVLRPPGRELRRRPGDGEGAGSAVDPARRPRAELLDLHGAAGGVLARQPVRLGSAPASTRSPVRCTAAQTRRCCRCLPRSRPTAATFRSSSTG